MNQTLIGDFTNHLKSNNKSHSTVIAYAKDLSQLDEKVSKPFNELTDSELQVALNSMREEMALTPKTISRKLNSFRTFYKYLQSKGIVKENPALNVQHPKLSPKLQRILSPVEYLALREVSRENNRLHTMIELMLQTGIRIGEISRLKVSDVQIKKNKGTLHIAEFSTTKSRTLSLNTKAIQALENYMKTIDTKDLNAPLFATRDGKHIIIRNIRSSIDRAMVKAGIENACVNDLRNTFIVAQLKAGVPVDLISDVVGHSSKNTTTKYLELLEKPYKANGESKLAEL